MPEVEPHQAETLMKKTKVLLTLVCAILLVATSVMGTLAYLTATTGAVNNTFTVSNISFDTLNGGLDEAKVDNMGNKVQVDGPNGSKVDVDRVTANKYKLVPGHTYTKDPTAHIAADSEDCYLFVKVENGISAIEAAGSTTIAAQMKTKGWTLISEGSNIYYYKDVVSAGADVVVFESFTLSGTADVSGYANASITIKAAAIQADGFNTALEAWNANNTLLN